MRALLLLSLALVVACGSRQPKCFECGLSDEWARAEAEDRERAESDAGPGEEAVSPDAQPGSGKLCGGFAGFQCPDGLECVDDPKDSCDPEQGGRDCSGICVVPGTDPPEPANSEKAASAPDR